MKKKIFYFLILMLFSVSTVFAKTIQNNEGVNIPEEKYNALVKIYGYNHVNFLSEEEYKLIKDVDLTKVKKIVYEEKTVFEISPLASYSTTYKTIILYDNYNGTFTIKLEWLKSPKTRSYDVIGARLQGLSMGPVLSFKQFYTDNGVLKFDSYANIKNFTNGFGASFLLSKKDNLEAEVNFRVSGSGTIYASYQHAQSSVSFEDSTNYYLSANGLGSVFQFNNGIGEKYDKMRGVSINL